EAELRPFDGALQREGGEAEAPRMHALLDQPAFRHAAIEGGGPRRRIHGPAEDDALAAVLVVRLEDQVVLAPAQRRTRVVVDAAQQARPREVAPERDPLLGGQEMRPRWIAQDREGGFAIDDSAA